MSHQPSETIRKRLAGMDRRSFIALLSSAAACYPLSGLAAQREQLAQQPAPQSLSDPWLTIAAVQEHLFPAETDSPGASDIQALTFLQNMMQAPDIDAQEKNFITQGVGWLNDIARKNKAAKFIQLNAEDREQVLRTIEQSRAGERWISLLLSYLIEALLSDPVYGGNPGGIGWKWLQHQPGYPTPGEDKKYYQLAQRQTFRRTRA